MVLFPHSVGAGRQRGTDSGPTRAGRVGSRHALPRTLARATPGGASLLGFALKRRLAKRSVLRCRITVRARLMVDPDMGASSVDPSRGGHAVVSPAAPAHLTPLPAPPLSQVDYQRIAQYYESRGEFDKAADMWSKCDQAPRAVQLYLKVRRPWRKGREQRRPLRKGWRQRAQPLTSGPPANGGWCCRLALNRWPAC
jgi:hypothetical protein